MKLTQSTDNKSNAFCYNSAQTEQVYQSVMVLSVMQKILALEPQPLRHQLLLMMDNGTMLQ